MSLPCCFDPILNFLMFEQYRQNIHDGGEPAEAFVVDAQGGDVAGDDRFLVVLRNLFDQSLAEFCFQGGETIA